MGILGTGGIMDRGFGGFGALFDTEFEVDVDGCGKYPGVYESRCKSWEME